MGGGGHPSFRRQSLPDLVNVFHREGDMGESGGKKGRVAVIGGGVAGLSTAHQLVRQGYEVHVIERRAQNELGGKAWSYAFPDRPPDCSPEQEELYAAEGLPG